MNEFESEREQEQSPEVSEQDPRYEFDPDFLRELDRAEFAGEERTIEGEILGTSKWTGEENVTLRVSIPLETAGPVEIDVPVPAPDEPLSTAKFGRLLKSHGYSRSQAEHLAGDSVECSYDGSWNIVDPNLPQSGPQQTSNTADTDVSESTTGTQTPAKAKRTQQLMTEGGRYGAFLIVGLTMSFCLEVIAPSLIPVTEPLSPVPGFDIQFAPVLNIARILSSGIIALSIFFLMISVFRSTIVR